jgi:hypothetical protein
MCCFFLHLYFCKTYKTKHSSLGLLYFSHTTLFITHPNDEADFFSGEVQVGLITDLEPEHTIHKVHRSGAKGLLTLQLPKAWGYRMGLKPHDYIFMEISMDGTEVRITKLQLPKLDDEDKKYVASIVPAHSDAAAILNEQTNPD